jgi:dolichol-phosphate mannosyltransferase
MDDQKRIALSIIVPVRNEGLNIEIMLKMLDAALSIPHEILVIHDLIDDSTVPIVEKLSNTYPSIKCIHNTLGRGVKNAIITGVNNTKGDYILIFAADEVGPILAIDDMLALMDEGCDLVSCTRYAYGGRRLGGSFIGGIISRVANKLFYTFSLCTLTDATTGIKMFKKSLFKSITLESKPVGWAVLYELAIKAQLQNFKLGEVPIISIDRLYGGTSTFSLGPWFLEYLKWFIWGAKHLYGKKFHKPIVKIPKATAL